MCYVEEALQNVHLDKFFYSNAFIKSRADINIVTLTGVNVHK